MDIPALSEQYFAAWAARDPDAIVALHTEDTQFRTRLDMEPAVGKEAVRTAFAELFERFPGFAFEVYGLFAGEAHWTLDWRLEWNGGAQGFDCIDLVVLSPEGLVARKDTFVDTAQLQAALGVEVGAR